MSRFPFSVTLTRATVLATVAVLGSLALLTVGSWERGFGAGRQAQLELAEQLEDLFASVAEDVRPAVVAINSKEAGSSVDDAAASLQTAFGSGFIVDSRGYILTNHHLVEHARTIRVRIHDGREFDGVLLRSDATSDIALIKVEATDLPVARLGDSDELRVGQWALAIGHPFGLMQTVSAGIVSALKRADLRILPFEDFIQTDASINPGNSGGPLDNLRGEVIGINTAIYSTSGSMNHGISFAVPINLAKVLTRRWIDGESVAFIGLSPGRVDADMAVYYGLESREGAFVIDVDEGGPAQAVGIQAMDVIVEFDGKTVIDENHLRVLIARQIPGEKTAVKVVRVSGETSFEIVPAARADRPLPPRPTPKPTNSQQWMGIIATSLTQDLRTELGANSDLRGVAVVQVRHDSAPWRKGMRPGDIITSVDGKDVPDLLELERRVMAAGKIVAFRVHRQGRDVGFFFVSR